MRRIAADTHVHLYSCYRLEDAFRSAWTNLNGLAAGGAADRTLLLFLAERTDSHFFRDLADGKTRTCDGWHVKPTSDGNAVRVEHAESNARLLVLNGRQIVTGERLEVLALAGDPNVPDGRETRQIIEATLSAGAVPVLPWAPGKWLFQRGSIVEGLLRAFQPRQLLIGDTTLRAACVGEPRLMRQGREKGFKIIAGTDPLPFAGEERMIGQYGVVWDGELDEQAPVRDVRSMLFDPLCGMRISGRRDGLLRVARRLVQNRQAKTARLNVQVS